MSFHRLWGEQPGFAVGLVRRLVKDLQAVAAAQGPPSIAQLRRFLALCNCVASFAKACGTALSGEIAGAAPRRASVPIHPVHQRTHQWGCFATMRLFLPSCTLKRSSTAACGSWKLVHSQSTVAFGGSDLS